ncbi:MAG TPA: YciI family protein [Vitreimonas sp.]|uniref:YciI family protein n=1 Tax=Vitreimonas sp. TaxID=3069702 RepID=UPI002D53929E|nr:YciI family protein [Vitreimonas sp.]HYD87603.1 YciI family protein [Vitreimonas sp.]
MQYMLLIYGDESSWAALTPDQIAQEMGAYMAYTQDLQKAGVYIAGHELQPVATAKTVSVDAGKQKVVDGPFAETKETLGGYYFIEAETMDDALAWAAKCPGARHGRIEVRPVVMR